MKNLKMNKKLIALVLASGLTLTSCSYEKGADVSEYDVLSTDNISSDNVLSGVQQELDVKGEDFKLLVNYSSGESVWRITSDKALNMEICTVNLPANLEVYIDNVHTDTSIVASHARFDGIKQDSMDDRIHNSQMIGFPISDEVKYYGINEIEGENDEFIQGFYYGINGYSSGEATQERYVESDFLKYGVWANRISTVIDLIIVDKNKNETRTVSVSSVLLVEINNIVTYSDGNVYQYDKNGKKRSLGKQ